MRELSRTTMAAAGLVWLLAACGGSSAPPAADPSSGEPTSKVHAAGSQRSMPGECIDPTVDGDKHDATRPFDKHVELDVRSIDLDNDGEVDAFVKPAWACGNSCNRSAYVVRGTCAHYVGTFPSTDRLEALDEMSNGLHDLLTAPRKMEEDGQVHCYRVVLKFDGNAYKPARHRECECKDDSPKCTAWESN